VPATVTIRPSPADLAHGAVVAIRDVEVPVRVECEIDRRPESRLPCGSSVAGEHALIGSGRRDRPGACKCVNDAAAVHHPNAVVAMVGDVEVPASVERHPGRTGEACVDRRAAVPREPLDSRSRHDPHDPVRVEPEDPGVLAVDSVDVAVGIRGELVRAAELEARTVRYVARRSGPGVITDMARNRRDDSQHGQPGRLVSCACHLHHCTFSYARAPRGLRTRTRRRRRSTTGIPFAASRAIAR
jgi:hypothetical protein